MGYTHYMPQRRDFNDAQWKDLTEKVKVIFDKSDVELAGPRGTGKPIIDKATISFNGAGDDHYETFEITKRHNAGFNFCKTNQKHYDVCVVAVLCIANHLAPGVLEITSDGNAMEWGAGLALAQHVCPGCLLPNGI